MSIERIEQNGELLAIIIRHHNNPEHVDFVTKEQDGLQLGFHTRQPGERVKAHQSLPFNNLVSLPSNKIYHLQSGKGTIDIYDTYDKKVCDVTLWAGDTIIFISGGHGMTFDKQSKMLEVKQGPYQQRENEKRFLE
ncbi:MAG: hypothetical protein CMH61_02870 [Nanoarchaeota archaeon]|nr:hypothetical protein [Nanoarchaeota archaeon]|tara:strand:- start:4235 stop:4642 length:408 start_codon:yes stop_codon:yes gene_type:complete